MACFPTGFHQSLFRELMAEPSTGLSFCGLVQELRGCLSRESCFGFSFVDQIGSKPASAHYFRRARPSFSHHWQAELRAFNRLMASNAPHA